MEPEVRTFYCRNLTCHDPSRRDQRSQPAVLSCQRKIEMSPLVQSRSAPLECQSRWGAWPLSTRDMRCERSPQSRQLGLPPLLPEPAQPGAAGAAEGEGQRGCHGGAALNVGSLRGYLPAMRLGFEKKPLTYKTLLWPEKRRGRPRKSRSATGTLSTIT